MSPSTHPIRSVARRRDLVLMGVAMAVTAGLLGVAEYLHLDHRFLADVRTGTAIIGRAAGGAVVFDNAREAAQTLKAFEAMPDVEQAELHLPEGPVLARYERASRPLDWLERHAGQTRVSVAVLENRQEVAHLEVVANRASLWATLLSMIGTVLSVMLLALATTHYVSRRMQAAVRRAEDRMQFLALHDSLTELYNRATFAQALERAVARTRRDGTKAALICLDVDNFKIVNDSHGHAAGDRVLIDLAQLLRRHVRDLDPVARLGGDEFAVLLEGPDAEEAARRVAEQLQASFDDAVPEFGKHTVGLSIGIAVIPRDADDATGALHCADVALYQAKRRGKRQHVVYSSELGETQRQRVLMERDLRHAIAHEQLQLAYQPVFDAAGRVQSLEALARWHHPLRGWVPPAEFIGVAEEFGLIADLSAACLGRLRSDLDGWRAHGVATVPVAVNVSAQQFRGTVDRQRFLARLAELALGPADIEFELTESVLFEDLQSPDSILVRLQDLGYALAIDDFGTGYSSLAYLRRIRCRKLKIDRAFVRSIHTDRENAMLVDAIGRVAHAMDIVVVAEGVECEAERTRLVELGCDLFQGFGLARPMAPAQVAELLGCAPAPADQVAAA